jgi:hypothetical protein
MSFESQSASNNSTLLALSVVLSIVGAGVVAVIAYIAFRIHKKRAETQVNHRRTGSITLDRSHPASRIVPFGAPGGETPRFSAYIFLAVLSKRPSDLTPFAVPTRFSPQPGSRHACRTPTARRRMGFHSHGYTAHSQQSS